MNATSASSPAAEALPARLAPTLATPGPLPLGADWVYEVKWDGVRAVVTIDKGAVRVHTRAGNDATATFPELAVLGDALADHRLVLDGELVAFDAAGAPSFHRMQQRLGVSAGAAQVRQHEVPVVFALFDLLHIDGASTRDLPWTQRRRLLDLVVDEPGPCWRTSTVFDDGVALADTTRAAGLEGVIAKRRDAPYRPGVRTPHWVKVKHLTIDEFVIGGWVEGDGKRSGGIGALLLGQTEGDLPGAPLLFTGRVGTGFTDAELTRLRTRLTGLARPDGTSPFAGPTGEPRAHYVEPLLRCEVEYREWSPNGTLRHPSYKGLVGG